MIELSADGLKVFCDWARKKFGFVQIRNLSALLRDFNTVTVLFDFLIDESFYKLEIYFDKEQFVKPENSEAMWSEVKRCLKLKLNQILEIIEYECVASYILDMNPFFIEYSRVLCRYCHKSPPEITFNNLAHATPASFGNNSLFSSDECDECNKYFGNYLESCFSSFIELMRCFDQIPNREGLSSVDANFLVTNDTDMTTIKMKSDKNKKDIQSNDLSLQFDFRLSRYVPERVLKMFYKMALAIAPKSYLCDFDHYRNWLLNLAPAESIRNLNHEVSWAFSPIPTNSSQIFLYRKISPDTSFAQYNLILNCKRQWFQLGIFTSDLIITEAKSSTPISKQLGIPERVLVAHKVFKLTGKRSVENNQTISIRASDADRQMILDLQEKLGKKNNS